MKNVKLSLFFVGLAVILLSSFRNDPPQTASIVVNVNSTKKLAGPIKIALCKDPNNFMESLFVEGVAKVLSSGAISYTFKNIPVGVYAIRIYQDIDGDGSLTTNVFGIPEEPFGFSQNPKIKYGPPSFKQASFEVVANTSVSIDLLKFEL